MTRLPMPGDAYRRRLDDCQGEHPQQCASVLDQYTPPQQIALLSLRHSEIARVVLARLLQSTARASFRDLQELAALRLASFDGRTHRLTPRGQFIADSIAREWAKQIDPSLIRTNRGLRRSIYQPGVKSRSNFW